MDAEFTNKGGLMAKVKVDEPRIWDRQPDEPIEWFVRLEMYRLMGPTRTIEAVWRGDADKGTGTRPSRQWYEQAAKWDWNGRCEEWDMENVAENRRRFAQEAARDKGERIMMLKEAQGKALQALRVADVTTAKFSEVMAAVRMVANELRSEYDDQPSQRHRYTMDELDREIERRARLIQLRSEGTIIGAYGVLAQSEATDDGWADDGDEEM